MSKTDHKSQICSWFSRTKHPSRAKLLCPPSQSSLSNFRHKGFFLQNSSFFLCVCHTHRFFPAIYYLLPRGRIDPTSTDFFCFFFNSVGEFFSADIYFRLKNWQEKWDREIEKKCQNEKRCQMRQKAEYRARYREKASPVVCRTWESPRNKISPSRLKYWNVSLKSGFPHWDFWA